MTSTRELVIAFNRKCEAEDQHRAWVKFTAETLNNDRDMLVSNWANYSVDDIVSLWDATCLSEGVNPAHKFARKDLATQLTAVNTATGESIKALRKVVKRYDYALHCARIGNIKTFGESHQISLSDFSKWALLNSWQLHDEFPVIPKPFERESQHQAASESKEQRQDRRLKACEDAGLVVPASSIGRLPDGVARIAALEGVKRQSFSIDVKAALKRREAITRPARLVRHT